MRKPGRVYVFDTSAFVAAWRENYPPDAFPAFWKRLDELARDGRVIAPDEVLHELGHVEDDPHKWVKHRKNLILRPIDEPLQLKTSEVLEKYQRLTAHGGKRGKADPFVVALARIEGATVVTKEKFGLNPSKPKIPDACAGFQVECFNLLQVIREEKWRF